MATAADIVKGALRRLQIDGVSSPIEPEEITDGVEDLNDWGSAHEVGFLQLGFTPVSVPADQVSIPVEAVGYFKDHLALYIAGQYGAPIPQTLALSAKDSKNRALNAFAPVINVAFSDTLPVGVANECGATINPENFFPSNLDQNF